VSENNSIIELLIFKCTYLYALSNNYKIDRFSMGCYFCGSLIIYNNLKFILLLKHKISFILGIGTWNIYYVNLFISKWQRLGIIYHFFFGFSMLQIITYR